MGHLGSPRRCPSISKGRSRSIYCLLGGGTKWVFTIMCRPRKLNFLSFGSKPQSWNDFDWGLLSKNENLNFPGLQMIANANRHLEMVLILCAVRTVRKKINNFAKVSYFLWTKRIKYKLFVYWSVRTEKLINMKVRKLQINYTYFFGLNYDKIMIW